MSDTDVTDVSPSPPSQPWTHYRAQVGNAVLIGDEAAEKTARQNLKAARAEEYLERLVAEAPPLPDDVRIRLAEILRP